MIKLYKEYVESKRLANLAAKVAVVEELAKLSFLSKRFILTEYLLTEEQLARNDELWGEEQGYTDSDANDLEAALEELKAEFDEAQKQFDLGVTE
jgi:hypothetical protein